MLGQEMETLIDGYMVAGYGFVKWNASRLPNGMYLYRINAYDISPDTKQTFTDVKKVLLFK
ncbi:MAG: hypothetical protein HYZ34_13260 [Ignavibacteriae bacterium]|nr:hypothetical protein [Ignavibacteriota bacterium]